MGELCERRTKGSSIPYTYRDNCVLIKTKWPTLPEESTLWFIQGSKNTDNQNGLLPSQIAWLRQITIKYNTCTVSLRYVQKLQKFTIARSICIYVCMSKFGVLVKFIMTKLLYISQSTFARQQMWLTNGDGLTKDKLAQLQWKQGVINGLINNVMISKWWKFSQSWNKKAFTKVI